MNKISQAFKHGKAFIPFITCGDPSLEVTEQLVYAMEQAGADLIELGIPFSDPTAEGPVIQEANNRALRNGVKTDQIFGLVKAVRQNTQIPIVFMTYANVVFSYGIERFIKKAAELGIDGIILPDIPFEEKTDFDQVCKKYSLALISMIAPTSKDRIRMIAKEAEGFIYCVSSLGVTGTRDRIDDEAGKRRDTPSMCGRVWRIYATAGCAGGGGFRWRYSRICNCKTVRTVWQCLRALCGRIC